MTTDAKPIQDDLGARPVVNRNRVDRTSVHAPSFVTLNAGVRCVARFFIKNIDANQALRGLEGSGLNPRTRQFALHASGALIRNDS
jgi:hypothetical protein